MSGDIAGIYGGDGLDTDRDDIPTGEFTALPAGWYPCKVDKAAVEETKKKDGKVLKLELTVVGDRYANRKVFPRINLMTTSTDEKKKKAVQIGCGELAGLGQACGIAKLSDTKELLGKFVDVRLKIRPAKGEYREDNQATAYAKVGTKSQGEGAIDAPKKAAATSKAPETAWGKPKEEPAAAAPPAPPLAPAPAAKGKMPWE